MLHVIAFPPIQVIHHTSNFPIFICWKVWLNLVHGSRACNLSYLRGEAKGASSQPAWLTKRGHNFKRDLDIAQRQNICLAWERGPGCTSPKISVIKQNARVLWLFCLVSVHTVSERWSGLAKVVTGHIFVFHCYGGFMLWRTAHKNPWVQAVVTLQRCMIMQMLQP